MFKSIGNGEYSVADGGPIMNGSAVYFAYAKTGSLNIMTVKSFRVHCDAKAN